MSAAASRRAKWPTPPPPSPKILHLPRRFTRPPSSNKPSPQDLRSLLAQEKTATGSAASRRDSSTSTSPTRKLDKSRGRKKIDGNDGIEKQMGKLKVRSAEVADYNDGASSSKPSSSSANHKQDINVEMLKRKMEGLSKGMLERMEYCGMSLLVSADDGDPNSDHAAGKNSSSYSDTVHHVAEKPEARKQRSQCRRVIGGRRREEAAAGSATRHQIQLEGEEAGKMGYGSCCRCKEVLARITAEVKAESAQWAEMKAMLDKVRLEMEELRSSRDQWQRRAVASELSLRNLHGHVVEWKRRARTAEEKVAELQERRGQIKELSTSDDWNFVRLPRIKCRQRPEGSPGAVEKEKHVLVCRLKKSGSDLQRRAPLMEIGNLENSAAAATASMK